MFNRKIKRKLAYWFDYIDFRLKEMDKRISALEAREERVMGETKKKTADIAAEAQNSIENSKKTINQARTDLGLNPIDDSATDALLKRV